MQNFKHFYQRLLRIPNSNAKNLLYCKTIFLLFALDNILKIQFGLNHCKCTGHTSDKMDYKPIYRSHKD